MIKECALESALYERELWKEQENKSREIAEKAGVVVIELSEAEIQKFRDAVIPLYKEYGGENQELIEKILEE